MSAYWGKSPDGRLRKPCPEDPVKLRGQPIGMYHCPDCMGLQVAAVSHLPPENDYETLYGQEWPPGYEET